MKNESERLKRWSLRSQFVLLWKSSFHADPITFCYVCLIYSLFYKSALQIIFPKKSILQKNEFDLFFISSFCCCGGIFNKRQRDAFWRKCVTLQVCAKHVHVAIDRSVLSPPAKEYKYFSVARRCLEIPNCRRAMLLSLENRWK